MKRNNLLKYFKKRIQLIKKSMILKKKKAIA